MAKNIHEGTEPAISSSLAHALPVVLTGLKSDRLEQWSDKLGNVDRIELHILMMVEDDPGVIIKEVRDALGIPNSTLTHVIDRMEKKGLISRTISDRDRRSYGLAMTPKGIELRKEHEHVLEMISVKVLECLDTEEERRQLSALAVKLAKKLGPQGEVP